MPDLLGPDDRRPEAFDLHRDHPATITGNRVAYGVAMAAIVFAEGYDEHNQALDWLLNRRADRERRDGARSDW